MAGDKNKPDYCCAAYDAMKWSWQVMADTCAGTPILREKRGVYLPKEPAEQTDPYNYRLNRAIFFNAVDLTLAGLVGMVFRNDPKLADNVPEAIRGKEAKGEEVAVEGLWENIDNIGTKGTIFLKEVFTDAVRDGHAAIFVDMPPALPEGSRLSDEKAAKRRPYWVSYEAKQIINWHTSVIDGQTKLTLIVFKECSKEPDGRYGQKEVNRYRVLMRKGFTYQTEKDGQSVTIVLPESKWELYRQTQNLGDGEFILEDQGGITFDDLPVAILYSGKSGILKSQPPLIDLAYTNIAHYQKYSDYSIYLHVSSRPVLCTKGGENPAITAIGPYTKFHVSTEGDVWFAETTGAALGAAREDLQDLKEQMSIMGLSLLVKRTGSQVTATEERGDQIEESSDLETWVKSLKDATESCLTFTAQFLDPKAETGGNIEIGAALDMRELLPEEMTAWQNGVAVGQFTRETMWKVLEAAGKLPADFDPKVEKEALEKEAQAKQEREIETQTALARNFDRGGPAEE